MLKRLNFVFTAFYVSVFNLSGSFVLSRLDHSFIHEKIASIIKEPEKNFASATNAVFLGENPKCGGEKLKRDGRFH